MEVGYTITVALDGFDTWMKLLDALDGYTVRAKVGRSVIENCEVERGQVITPERRRLDQSSIQSIHVY